MVSNIKESNPTMRLEFLLFLPDLQPLENVLGLVQNLSQNLVAELAPLGLGDFVVLELAEHDRVLVCHGVTLVDAAFSVYFFFRLFSDLNHHPVVVAEVVSAGAALGHRGEVNRFRRNHHADVGDCFRLSLAVGHTRRAVRLAVRHTNQSHRLELAHLQNRNLVLHGHTMG